MTDVCEVVITAPDAEWLADFTHGLVEDRLVAGAHIVETIRSIYRWKGEVHDRAEARVALHTRTNLVPKIIDAANALHPYEVPCVIALPVADGNPEYLAWVIAETQSDS